jgi:hypothetical protein
MWANSVNFKKARSKQSPMGRKFAKSGHPGSLSASSWLKEKKKKLFLEKVSAPIFE